MSKLQIRHTVVFKKNYEAYLDPNIKIIVNQGGARSSKTVSVTQLYILLAYTQFRNDTISIIRKTLSALKGTALKDFLEQMKALDLYRDSEYNKSEHIYRLKSNEIEFQGLDQPQKKRGAKRKLLFCNEANELTYEDFMQLLLRTDGKIFLDYNPSDDYHWIYDKVLTRPDCRFIQSTYKDNPFLSNTLKSEIERLKDQDENYWRIYGLGEKGISREIIYTNWHLFKDYPAKIDETYYGLDFGFNNPTAFTQIDISDTVPYLTEKIYQTGLTNNQVITKLGELKVSKSNVIYCDNAEPARIEEICKAGYNAKPADKSVKDGIDYMKRQKLMIHEDSVNLIKEIKSYKWKVNKDGITLDEPVKFNDHLMDSARYGLYTHTKKTDFKAAFVDD